MQHKQTAIHRIIAISTWFFLIIPLISSLLATTALIIYMYAPYFYKAIALPLIDDRVEHVMLSAHGLRDSNKSWGIPLGQRYQSIYNQQESNLTVGMLQTIALDWNPYSQNTFRCSVDGYRIGKMLGKHLSAAPRLNTVHLVAHSCGSFVILGLCNTIKSDRVDVRIHSTYLDPVSIYGGLFWDYGINHFGSCAHYSEAYIDTADTIPGSNQLLPNTHTFDVTTARKVQEIQMAPHDWPTRFYQQLVASGHAPSLYKPEDPSVKYPPGQLDKVSNVSFFAAH